MGGDWAEAFAGRAFAFQSYEEYGRMLADLERSLTLRPDAQVSAIRTYVLATCPDAGVRDGKRAVIAAEETQRLADATMESMVQTCLAVAQLLRAGERRAARAAPLSLPPGGSYA